jgi:hypothetical protein
MKNNPTDRVIHFHYCEYLLNTYVTTVVNVNPSAAVFTRTLYAARGVTSPETFGDA